MKNDDEPIGRVLSRREVLELIGSAGAFILAGGATLRPSHGPIHSRTPGTLSNVDLCIARPEQTEGPYFVDSRLKRSDIRSDTAGGLAKPGLPFTLTILVSRVNGSTCEPLEGAHVDLWHCDAGGIYSGVRDLSFDTREQDFLRGYQVTNSEGAARFITIYPGWYPGRTVHFHFKIRLDPAARQGLEFTSQLYFDDALSDRVFGSVPYAAAGRRRTRNREDGIFRRDGVNLMLSPVESKEGLQATFSVGLQIT